MAKGEKASTSVPTILQIISKAASVI